MVKIRLTRVGSKFQASYRIIVTDSRRPRDTRPIETLGYFNPRTRPSTEVVDEARALYWLSVGAQPTESTENILKRLGTLDRYARMKNGESIEVLVEEAQKTAKPLPDQRTNYPSPEAGTAKSKKSNEKKGVK
jgi:small subunit ribosomal protein S16